MKWEKIRLIMEKNISREIRETIQFDIISEIYEEAKVENNNDFFNKIFDGQCFKLSSTLSPRLFKLCYDVKNLLEIDDKIDFYIANSNNINAYTIPKIEKDGSHIIVLNSGLVEKFDDDELKFVVGHEMGHIISKNADVREILLFIFDDISKIPLILRNKINFWEKLSELSADRFGMIATNNLNKVISTFFKLSSGISTNRINFNFKEYLYQNRKLLDKFENTSFNKESHPINPLRLEAIRLFSESNLFKSISKGMIIEDEMLTNEIQKLLSKSFYFLNSELDELRMYFIISAGLIISTIDHEFSKEEYEQIIATLSNFVLFPKQLFDKIVKENDIEKIFITATQKLLEINPSEKYVMLDFLVSLAMADNILKKSEINFIFDIGQTIFKLTKKEISQFLAEKIHTNFIPKII